VALRAAAVNAAGQHSIDITGGRRQVDAAIKMISLLVNAAAG
jgi:hypothetical protein